MKFPVLFLLLFVCTAATVAQDKNISYNPNEKKDTTKKSIRSAAVGKIATANVRINYYSPGVRGRIIWGGVVPLNEVWVTGAHAATNIEIDKAFVIGNTAVPAGTYAIFTIPSENDWTFILNKNYQQHLTDEYDQKEDILRINVKPIASTAVTERLQYFIENNRIIIAWEKLRIEVPVSIQ
ncbi:MAG: DUF2911 domain-containing protein [Chitinophagaceae bacterium]|nr:DUF2911 domain-containing protein [Chitinophagaceae bacterium]